MYTVQVYNSIHPFTRYNIHSPCAGGGVPNILHQVSVPVIDNLSCQEMFNSSGHKKTIRDSFLCAGYKDGKKDSCEVRQQ